MVFLCMALVEGFRACRSVSDKAERRGQETGISRYRRALQQSNRDRLLVLIGAQYAIVRNYEFALLLGAKVRLHEDPGETVEQVLARYGVTLPLPTPNSS
jgi:hypothetical protein